MQNNKIRLYENDGVYGFDYITLDTNLRVFYAAINDNYYPCFKNDPLTAVTTVLFCLSMGWTKPKLGSFQKRAKMIYDQTSNPDISWEDYFDDIKDLKY